MSSVNLEKIRELQKYFYDREMLAQDAQLTPEERAFLVDRAYGQPTTNRFAGSALGIDPTIQSVSDSPFVDRIKSRLTKGTPVQVKSTLLGGKTDEEYSEDPYEVAAPNLTPLLRRMGSRVGKFGEQYVDNVPGLSALGKYSEDESVGTAGALIQAGGRVAPALGALWLGLNAGPTAAGTLEDARIRGYVR